MRKKEYWVYSRYANIAISFGVTMLASIFLGYWAGSWLDSKYNTGPFLLVTCILAGVALGFYSIIKEIIYLEYTSKKMENNKEEDNNKENKEEE